MHKVYKSITDTVEEGARRASLVSSQSPTVPGTEPALGYMLSVAILKLLIIEQEVPHLHFVLSPTIM